MPPLALKIITVMTRYNQISGSTTLVDPDIPVYDFPRSADELRTVFDLGLTGRPVAVFRSHPFPFPGVSSPIFEKRSLANSLSFRSPAV